MVADLEKAAGLPHVSYTSPRRDSDEFSIRSAEHDEMDAGDDEARKLLVAAIERVATPEPSSIPPPGGLSEARASSRWMDGVRGMAACLVYWQHASQIGALHAQPYIEGGFGWEGRHQLLSLPFLRFLPASAHAMVPLFFVLGGYGLSKRPIGAMHRADYAAVGKIVSSGLFKRPFRLYVPFVVITVCFYAFLHITNWTQQVPGLSRMESFPAELRAILSHMLGWSFIGRPRELAWDWYPRNFPGWTLPRELQGSVYLYITLMLTMAFAPGVRMAAFALTIWYFGREQWWHVVCFCMGGLICELEMVTQTGRLKWPSIITKYRQHLAWALLLLSIFLAGQPCTGKQEHLERDKVWKFLLDRMPFGWRIGDAGQWRWYWLMYSASGMVIALMNLPVLRRFFERDTLQWLGRHSFSLYLVHGEVLVTFGRVAFQAVGSSATFTEDLAWWQDRLKLPDWGIAGLTIDYLAAQWLFCIPLTLALTVLAHRYIEQPAVRATDALYQTICSTAWLQDKQDDDHDTAHGNRTRATPGSPLPLYREREA
ncbi:hypothetical protein PYCC9005_001692 [Savitreella phatthalungensis]